MTRFTVILELAEEGGFVISCPALPGCYSQGETKKDALKNIRDAIALYLQTLNDRAKTRPKHGQVLKVAV